MLNLKSTKATARRLGFGDAVEKTFSKKHQSAKVIYLIDSFALKIW